MVMVDEDRLERAAETLERAVDAVANQMRRQLSDNVLKQIADCLHQQDNPGTTRMAAALMGNAFVFERAIDGEDDPNTSLRLPVSRPGDSRETILSNWDSILDYNYWPIFWVASQVLEVIPDRLAREVTDPLINMAVDLAEVGVTKAGDLAGQMFGKLITDRKFLAAFYTLPESAFLLAETCITRMEETIQPDWSNVNQLSRLRIADFACGTGALLTASYQLIAARIRRAGGDDLQLHRPFMEQVITGSDVMPASVHLTATLLASVLPTQTFEGTNIELMPYGKTNGEEVRVGSLELLDTWVAQQLGWLGDNRRRTVGGTGEKEDEEWFPHHSADLILMNPPFTRSTNYENFDDSGYGDDLRPIPTFRGLGTDPATQQAMSDQLSSLVVKKRGKKRSELFASDGYAGLASHFTDLADVKIKPGGTVGLIVPFTCLTGGSWEKWRNLFFVRYNNLVVYTIASADGTGRAFSADTGMAEAMIVATRRDGMGQGNPVVVLYVNLQRRPASPAEAVAIAHAVAALPIDRFAGEIMVGDTNMGSWAKTDRFDGGGWGGVHRMSVASTAEQLGNGRLVLPPFETVDELPLVPISEVGHAGPVDRLVGNQVGEKPSGGHYKEQPGPFEFRVLKRLEERQRWPTFDKPILWSHNHALETRLEVLPDCDGVVKHGRNNDAKQVFNTCATRFHPNRDFRLNSQPLAACLTPEPCLGGRAWPSVVLGTPKPPTDQTQLQEQQSVEGGQQKMLDNDTWERKPEWEYPAVLWANTTLGLMDFWFKGSRQQQGKAILTVSRLGNLLTIDPRQLSDQQLQRAKEIYYQFKSREFLPANEAYRDQTRQALDEAVLGDLLGLDWEAIKGPLAKLRLQWCCEPSVHGGKSTRPPEA